MAGVVNAVGWHEHVAVDQAAGLQRLVGGHLRAQVTKRRIQRIDAIDRAELGDLPQKLTGLHGLERILVLELGDHQGEKIFLIEHVLLRAVHRSRC